MDLHLFPLLSRFLTYYPGRRITAEDGLKHEYFRETPLPIDPSMFPTWPAKSEQQRVKRGTSPRPPEGGLGYSQLVSYLNHPLKSNAEKPQYLRRFQISLKTKKQVSRGPLAVPLKRIKLLEKDVWPRLLSSHLFCLAPSCLLVGRCGWLDLHMLQAEFLGAP